MLHSQHWSRKRRKFDVRRNKESLSDAQNKARLLDSITKVIEEIIHVLIDEYIDKKHQLNFLLWSQLNEHEDEQEETTQSD